MAAQKRDFRRFHDTSTGWEFTEDCKTILRDPGHRAGNIQQVRDQCTPTPVKASEWVFGIDKIKGQVPREEALARFTRAVKPQLTD
ncbi:hypothetical protein CYMTET_21801 [Cymbomonas tetramitiformis]|uniref:Uncharacterized protein n=1 Tax=Cymbomonas tetramitiformis TaxID=36881 RepID=A0AAE0G1U6_9CHLO|nr:hypothetical protein CYMTET_21801 [Cymbomonas tetramitiformis]